MSSKCLITVRKECLHINEHILHSWSSLACVYTHLLFLLSHLLNYLIHVEFALIFCNLKMKSRMCRYVEAIREFNKILLYIYKTKQYHQKSPQYEQILKKNEQMYALLAICLSLCPQVKLVDEAVNSQLREKYGEKMLRMQRYDDEAFALYDELFSYACPKFITPSAPSYEEPLVNYNQVVSYYLWLTWVRGHCPEAR